MVRCQQHVSETAERNCDRSALTCQVAQRAAGARAYADASGQVFGGHVARGCRVRTTAELLLVLLPEHRFSRELDPSTGFMELVIQGEPDANLA